MSRSIYDPTANCLLDDKTYRAIDESGLSVIQSPSTREWFVLDPWTRTSRKIDTLDGEQFRSVMRTIETELRGATLQEAGEFAPMPPREPRKAAGGVVIDASGRILLRAPLGSYGGYVWTFPKGGLDPGETWPAAAMREVEEETGWSCRITKRLGTYAGDTSVTRFYLMHPVAQVRDPDAETEDVAWVRAERAVQLLAKTRTPRGRKRDLTVLRDALVAHDLMHGTQFAVRAGWSLSRLLDDPEPTEAVAPRQAVRVVLPSALMLA